MKKNSVLKLISLFLAVIFTVNVFAGCSGAAEEPEVNTDETNDPFGGELTVQGGSSAKADDKFTLRYTDEESLNPLRCENAYNDAVTSLMYEGLFRLDAQFRPVPVLCEDYYTNDGVNYLFDIIDVQMHDGSKLTSYDVVYSINSARLGSKYVNRLDNIAFCAIDDEDTVFIQLYEADYGLPAILDVPIIRSGAIDSFAPAGTGPYYYNSIGGSAGLTPFKAYRGENSAGLERIHLEEFTDASVEESFANYTLDCIWEDTAGENPINLYSDHEARYYDTSILQYVGFNSSTPVLKDPNIRLAVHYAVNRQLIIDDIFGGYGKAANLIFNPCYYAYSAEWEEGYEYSAAKISSYLAASGLDDRNSDGYLEYPVSGSYQYFELRFLVCNANDKKVKAAENIAENLRSVGLKVIVNAVSWTAYKEALKEGEFDLYYAEVALAKNFDFARIIGEDGYLDHGEMGSKECEDLCAAYMIAQSDEEKAEATRALCAYVAERALIVPVMYRQYVVYTHRGVISNFMPVDSGVFGDVAGWTVRLKDED